MTPRPPTGPACPDPASVPWCTDTHGCDCRAAHDVHRWAVRFLLVAGLLIAAGIAMLLTEDTAPTVLASAILSAGSALGVIGLIRHDDAYGMPRCSRSRA